MLIFLETTIQTPVEGHQNRPSALWICFQFDGKRKLPNMYNNPHVFFSDKTEERRNLNNVDIVGNHHSDASGGALKSYICHRVTQLLVDYGNKVLKHNIYCAVWSKKFNFFHLSPSVCHWIPLAGGESCKH